MEASAVAAATQEHGDTYTIIGLPLSEGDQAVADFINGRGVNTITHVLGTDRLWGQYGANSLPSWMTITADGQTRSGGGSMPNSVLDGSWAR